MKFIKSKYWSAIFILTSLLIALMLLMIVFKSLHSFYEYKQLVAHEIELTVDVMPFFIKNEFKKEWAKLSASKPLRDNESPLKTMHISVKDEGIKLLNSNLPSSGKNQFIKGRLRIGGEGNQIQEIKLRYRGDNNFHWLYEQKSLRIKLTDGKLYNMEKEFNLINHPNWHFHRDILSYQLAKRLGLTAPEYYPVRVFINGRYKGVYMYLSQVNESLLRKHKLMPGSIYSGDYAQKNNRGVRNLWSKQDYWVKKAARNAEQKENKDDIAYFIKAPYENDQQFFKMFHTLFDSEKFISFMALDRLVGSGHHDYHHNHKIYFDPYRGKFEPIEWDVRLWSAKTIKDVGLNPLLLKMKANPILDAEIDKKVYSLIESGIQLNLLERIDGIYDLVQSDLDSDYLKDNAVLNKFMFETWISTPFSMRKYKKWMGQDKKLIGSRIDYLKKIYNASDIKYSIRSVGENEYNLVFKVNGEVPININFDNFLLLQKKKRNELGNTIFKDVTVYPGRKLIKNSRTNYVALHGRDEVVNLPQYYEFYVKTNNIERFIDSIKVRNFITEKEAVLEQEGFDVLYDAEVLHPWDFVRPENEIVTLQGTIAVNQTMVFEQNTSVNIAPGTTFVFAENSSLFFYGKVTALGTKASPIRFVAKDKQKPWGLVAVQGKATTGSKFEYVEFENGSIDTRNLIHYTSPFNIHDTDWFEVRHCKIGRNFIGDDAMHVAYAKGIIDGCEFYDARSDALDIDISDVTVTNNVFYNAGNDGLDIMTTTMNAQNNVFIDTGDKGISVGEWSEANITGSLFLRTAIGLEVKDKSSVKANNLVVIDSKDKGINLYNKNKRYDEGGFLNGETIYLLENTKVKADKRSRKKIKHSIENTLPDLKQYGWYESLQNTTYKKFIDEIEVKYAQ